MSPIGRKASGVGGMEELVNFVTWLISKFSCSCDMSHTVRLFGALSHTKLYRYVNMLLNLLVSKSQCRKVLTSSLSSHGLVVSALLSTPATRFPCTSLMSPNRAKRVWRWGNGGTGELLNLADFKI